ncbi:MAG: hypothetical protein QM790_20970 [Nibricoccus sp.]
MNKQQVAPPTEPLPESGEAWLNLEQLSHIRLTSEDPLRTIEAALVDYSPGGWRAAQPGPQTLWIHFIDPQKISLISLGFEATESRTQEFLLSYSRDKGTTYHELVRQQFNFSARTTREDENYASTLDGITDLRLDLVPDVSHGGAYATLKYLRVR